MRPRSDQYAGRGIPRLLALILCAATALLQASPSFASGPDDFDIRSLSAKLHHLRESIDTLTFTSVDDVTLPDHTERRERYAFAWASGGRTALVVDFFSEAGKPLRIYDAREDGRLKYQVGNFRDYPNDPERLEISRQPSTFDKYTGLMFRALWLLRPCGRAYDSLIEHGERTEVRAGGNADRLTVATSCDGRRVTVALVPKYDYTAESVEAVDESAGGYIKVEATSFARVNGVWFPVAGRSEERPSSSPEPGTKRATFRLEDLRINQKVPPDAFGRPPLPAGVTVNDNVRRRTDFVGGIASLRRWRELHPPVTQRLPSSTEIVASRSPPSIPWGTVFGALSILFAVVAGLVALTARLRARRS